MIVGYARRLWIVDYRLGQLAERVGVLGDACDCWFLETWIFVVEYSTRIRKLWVFQGPLEKGPDIASSSRQACR